MIADVIFLFLIFVGIVILLLTIEDGKITHFRDRKKS